MAAGRDIRRETARIRREQHARNLEAIEAKEERLARLERRSGMTPAERRKLDTQRRREKMRANLVDRQGHRVRPDAEFVITDEDIENQADGFDLEKRDTEGYSDKMERRSGVIVNKVPSESKKKEKKEKSKGPVPHPILDRSVDEIVGGPLAAMDDGSDVLQLLSDEVAGKTRVTLIDDIVTRALEVGVDKKAILDVLYSNKTSEDVYKRAVDVIDSFTEEEVDEGTDNSEEEEE